MFGQSSIGLAALMAFVTTPLLFNAGRAAVVTVDFSGTVLQATAPLNSPEFGATFAGSFSYDNAATATYRGLNYYGGTDAIDSLSGFALNYFGGYSFPPLSDGTLELSTSTVVGSSSGWIVNVIPRTGQAAQVSFGFGGSAGYLSSASLEAGLPFFKGSSNQSPPVSLNFFDPNLRSAGLVVGKITSIGYEPTSPAAGGLIATPEPASIAVLDVGLAGICLIRRRSKIA